MYEKNKEEIFYGDLLKILGIEEKYSEENVGIELDYYGIPNQEANNLSHMWDEFANELKFKNRYFLSSDKNKNLLENISEVLPYLVISYRKGTFFYRARINSSRHQEYNCGPEMSVPPSEKCSGGRANPVGIPYLYVATENNTAIGEVEPLLSDSVTVAILELKNSIDIIKLSRPISPFLFGDGIHSIYPIYDFLIYLGIQLSIPHSKASQIIDYLPTQYLCEFIKTLDFLECNIEV